MSDVRASDFPAFHAWSRRFSPEMPAAGYLQGETTLLSALLLAELIFPRLVEVRGCVIRADKFEQVNFEDWLEHLSGDREQVERVINFYPTRFHFDYPGDETEARALDVLANRISLGWRAAAALQFPDRSMVVEVIDGTEDDGPTVLMYTRAS